MNSRKSQNSSLYLTTLGAFVLAILFSSSGSAFAQSQPDILINRRPLKDLGFYVQDQAESKSVDLDAPFLIELTGTLSKDGKIEAKTAKYIKTEGDEKIVEIAKKAIEAVNDSGYFQYLSELSATNILIRMAQNESEFSASITSQAPSESRARSAASALGMMVQLAEVQKNRNRDDQNYQDDLLLLEKIKISSEGKQFVISFDMPKAFFRDRIEQEISKRKSTPQ